MKAKTGLLALMALLGITSAFTTKHCSNFKFSTHYGVLGSFFIGSVRHYYLTVFKDCSTCSPSQGTCSGTAAAANLKTIATAAFDVTESGTYIPC